MKVTFVRNIFMGENTMDPHGTEQTSGSSSLISRSERLLQEMKNRRSVRAFSERPIPLAVIERCIAIAASAPSGANLQPWSFVVVQDPSMKKKIRRTAEEIEEGFYRKTSTKLWRDRLKPIGTGPEKPFLEHAPYLICIFFRRFGVDAKGKRSPNYYAAESVGIATGFLISSLHLLGLSALTYTPAPMDFLKKLLDRPENESPFMVIAVGYRDGGYEPPDLARKKREEYLTVI